MEEAESQKPTKEMFWGAFVPKPRDPVNQLEFDGRAGPCLCPLYPVLSSLPLLQSTPARGLGGFRARVEAEMDAFKSACVSGALCPPCPGGLK